MAEIDALYQALILEHNRNPRRHRILEPCTHHASGRNPVCGDQVDLYLRLDGEVVEDAAFQGEGCAISTASASLMVELAPGRSVAELRALFAVFEAVLHGRCAPDEVDMEALAPLAGVRYFPGRLGCAVLPWQTLLRALPPMDV